MSEVAFGAGGSVARAALSGDLGCEEPGMESCRSGRSTDTIRVSVVPRSRQGLGLEVRVTIGTRRNDGLGDGADSGAVERNLVGEGADVGLVRGGGAADNLEEVSECGHGQVGGGEMSTEVRDLKVVVRLVILAVVEVS